MKVEYIERYSAEGCLRTSAPLEVHLNAPADLSDEAIGDIHFKESGGSACSHAEVLGFAGLQWLARRR